MVEAALRLQIGKYWNSANNASVWSFWSVLRGENLIQLLVLHQMSFDKKPTIQWHSSTQCLTARICLDKNFIAISTRKSWVRSFQRASSKDLVNFIFVLCEIIRFRFIRPDVEETRFIYEKEKQWTAILNGFVMQIYRSGEVNHCSLFDDSKQ